MSLGLLRFGRYGSVRRVKAWSNEASCVEAGEAWTDMVSNGMAGLGPERLGRIGLLSNGLAGLGGARSGTVRQVWLGRIGQDRLVPVCFDFVRFGMAGMEQ